MFLSPLQIIKYTGVTPGMQVADFGSGRGEHTLLLNDRLQGEGAVYTFDIVPEMVDALQRTRLHEAIDTLFPLCVDLNSHLPLKDALLHCALVSNTLHALVEREHFLHELHRVLKQNGRVVFTDWASSFNNMGPKQSDIITPGEAVRLFEAHGFKVGEMLPAGSHHYAFVATKV